MRRMVFPAGLILSALAIWWLWPLGEKSTSEAITANGSTMVVVSLPHSFSGQEPLGEKAFTAFCVTCHGVNAAGSQGFGPPLVHKIYEPSHHGDMAFVMAAERGVASHHWPFGNMPPVSGITRAEISSIVAYIRALQRANGIN